MVVPTGKRTRPAQTASHFLFLHLYLRLRGTKVSPPCCSPADSDLDDSCSQSFLTAHTAVWEGRCCLCLDGTGC